MAEQKQSMAGFIGPSYTSRAQRFDCQRAVNMYLETDPTGGGKGQQPAVLIATPGLKYLQSIGLGPIRAVYTLSNQQVMYVVSGASVYQLSGSLLTPLLLTGSLSTEAGPVSIADNGIQVMLVDGSFGYYITIGSTTLNTVVDPNFYPADVVVEQDGYFIFNQSGTANFFISSLYQVVPFPVLNTAAKAGYSDILICAYSINRELYLLGAENMEVWYDDGTSGTTPFVRQDGKNSQIGCVSAASVAKLQNTMFWLGANAQGGGIVYMLENGSPKRVSTYAIEFAIQEIGDLSGAVGWAYQQEGHSFYVLNIPGSPTTWVFDMEIDQWHERQSTVNGAIGRHLAQNHCVLNGQHIVGDWNSPNIYALDLDTYTDNGQNRLFMRQSPHVSSNLNRMFYKLMEVDCQFGVGLSDNGVPQSDVNPRVILQISNDGGQTFGNPIIATLGKIGQYNHRARWARLGSSRDRVFRVSCTDNVRFTLLSAFLDYEVGNA